MRLLLSIMGITSFFPIRFVIPLTIASITHNISFCATPLGKKVLKALPGMRLQVLAPKKTWDWLGGTLLDLYPVAERGKNGYLVLGIDSAFWSTGNFSPEDTENIKKPLEDPEAKVTIK